MEDPHADRIAAQLKLESTRQTSPYCLGLPWRKSWESTKKDMACWCCWCFIVRLGMSKKRSPNSDVVDVSFNGYRLKQIREYMMFIVGFTTSPWSLEDQRENPGNNVLMPLLSLEISQSVILISPKTSYSHHDLPLALDFLPKERH